MGKVAFASFIGTAIEFYDFYIYGTAAALVLGGAFFPEFSEAAGTLASFATFAVAFFARPVGGAVFGHYGDRVGRKAMLIFSLLLTGVSTFLIGLLPGYAAIGIWAPALLVALRFLQGFGLGGEWGGAVLLATEHATEGRRGFYSTFPQMGPAVGFLLSSGFFLILTSSLSEDQFASWGWRLPFLASIVLVAIGLYVRVTISETPVFRRAMETQTRARVPFFDMVRTYPRVLLLSSGGMALAYVLFYTITTFSLSYGTTQLGMSSTTLLYCAMISVAIMGVSVPSPFPSSPRSPAGWAAGGCAWRRRFSPGSGRFPSSGSSTPGTRCSSRSPRSAWSSSPCSTARWGRFCRSSKARGSATAGPPSATTSAASSGARSRP